MTMIENSPAESFKVELPRSIRALRETWQPYKEASLGFANHWYLGGFATELEDDKPMARVICGQRIAFRRVHGKIRAIEDRCAHRLVPFSVRWECFTKETISCWYHGFTYSWHDGGLVRVLSDPHCGHVGKLKIRSYPVEEFGGFFFVYIGDGEPPPLSEDLPPSFLDADRVFCGRGLDLKSNWRLAAENGIDSTHFYVHRNSPAWRDTAFVVPPAVTPVEHHLDKLVYYLRPGPVGLADSLHKNWEPVFEAEIGDVADVISTRVPENGWLPIPEIIAIWLPGIIEVDPWPPQVGNFYEFYVPVDEEHHRYFQISSAICPSEREAAEYQARFETEIKQRYLNEFASDDMLARLGLQSGYASEDGWRDETLVRTDDVVIAWRQLISRLARGKPMSGPAQTLVGSDQQLIDAVLGQDAPKFRVTNMP